MNRVMLLLLLSLLPLIAPAANHGEFIGRVVVEWVVDTEGRERDIKLIEPFGYIDPDGVEWRVPAGAVVNGASIPKSLWTLTSSPYVGNYRRASVIHDYYCDHPDGRGWKAVHRMFLDASIAGGVNAVEAKAMYAAVYLGGPRWDARGRPVDRSQAMIDRTLRLYESTVGSWIRFFNPNIDSITKRLDDLLEKF